MHTAFYVSDKVPVDPNIFFALYTMLILVMTVSVVALSRNMEPDCILQQRENPDAVVEDHFVNNLVSTFHTIYERMRYPEIYMCLIYFVL